MTGCLDERKNCAYNSDHVRHCRCLLPAHTFYQATSLKYVATVIITIKNVCIEANKLLRLIITMESMELCTCIEAQLDPFIGPVSTKLRLYILACSIHITNYGTVLLHNYTCIGNKVY